MGDQFQLVRAVSELIAPDARAAAVRGLSSFIGIETFIVFIPDPENGSLLAAPGFPQTFPQARRWKDFLKDCALRGKAEAQLPCPGAGALTTARAVKSSDGSVVVLIGGPPHPCYADELMMLMPLLTSALKCERAISMHAAQARFAEDLARQSSTLAQRLDEARRTIHKELEEHQRTASALRKVKEELQHHAAELEQRVAERTVELSETVHELEAFSYSVAHDMRAPLRAMQGYAGFVLDEGAGKLDAPAVQALQKISAAALRLDRLILDVLNYSRLVRTEFQLTPVDVDRLTREIIDNYQDWHPPAAEVVIEGKLPMVFGNEAFLTQCVTNLVGNAIKFVPPGRVPQVKISGETIQGDVRLYFKDNGLGIAAKDQQRIFRIFERLHSPKEYEGTGIGLAIVRKAVERMGGQVGVDSEPDGGSRFWLQLKGLRASADTSC